MAIINPRQVLRFRAAAVGSEAQSLQAARQNPVVTQTITRPYTTITALVTLGPGEPTSTAAQTTLPTLTSPSPSSSSSTAAAVAVPGAVSASSSALTQAQLGAIIASVLGSILLIILIWYCVAQQRRRQNEPGEVRYVLEDETETSSETAEVMTMPAGGRARRMMPADPWARGEPGIGVVPPPPRFPPTPRYTPYRQTRNPQIRGVRRYP
jgi:hypothetical protein